jgi:ectoine hydroxylase-related dioxygenase (phytanoyl-CoA dioxygenase family)
METLTANKTDTPLPTPTEDLERAFADLDAHGYCIVANVLSPAQVAALRERVVAQAEGEEASGQASGDHASNQRIWMLANKGKVFRELAVHPFARTMMTRLLGENFLVSSLTANIARPGGAPMFLHTDQLYVDFWTPKPAVANILYMLDDFTDENGGTRLIPGSHLRPQSEDDIPERTIGAEGPAGAALVFDGRMVHGTGANRTTDKMRHAILAYHCAPYMRQQENFFLGLDPALETPENEELLQRLGYKIWHGLGRTEKPGEVGLMTRGATIPTLGSDGRPQPAETGLPKA